MMKPGMPQISMQTLPYEQPPALPPYLQALFPSGLPPMAMPRGAGPSMQAFQGRPMQFSQPQNFGGRLPPNFATGQLQTLLGQSGGMMPAPLEAAEMTPQEIAPQNYPFQQFSLLGAPRRAMKYR